VAITLAYYHKAKNMVVKGFTIQAAEILANQNKIIFTQNRLKD
jgi:hypothetical protein